MAATEMNRGTMASGSTVTRGDEGLVYFVETEAEEIF